MELEGGRPFEPPSSRCGSGGVLTFSIERILAPDFGPKVDGSETGDQRGNVFCPHGGKNKLTVEKSSFPLISKEQCLQLAQEKSSLYVSDLYNFLNFNPLPYIFPDRRILLDESFIESSLMKECEKNSASIPNLFERPNIEISNSYNFNDVYNNYSNNKCLLSPNKISKLRLCQTDQLSPKKDLHTKQERNYVFEDCSKPEVENLRNLKIVAENNVSPWKQNYSSRRNSVSEDFFTKDQSFPQNIPARSPIERHLGKTIKSNPCNSPELKPFRNSAFNYNNDLSETSRSPSLEDGKSELMKLQVKLKHSIPLNSNNFDNGESKAVNDANRCSSPRNSCSSSKTSPAAVVGNDLEQCDLVQSPVPQQLDVAVDGKSIWKAKSDDSSINCSSSGNEKAINCEEKKHVNKESTNPSDTGAITSKEIDLDNEEAWPIWVFATRYSCRPSSGPRLRRNKKKERSSDEKRCRTAFSGAQLSRLKQEFQENPYLSEKRRTSLAQDLKLTESQVKIWFQNHRAKKKRATKYKNPLALKLMAHGLYNHSTIK